MSISYFVLCSCFCFLGFSSRRPFYGKFMAMTHVLVMKITVVLCFSKIVDYPLQAEVTQRLSNAKEAANKPAALQSHEDLAKKLQVNDVLLL